MIEKLLWHLPFEVDSNSNPFLPGTPFIQLGSCFAGVLAGEMVKIGWPCQPQPLGIAYNPASISRHMGYLSGEYSPEKNDFFLFEKRYRHFDFHSDLTAGTVVKARDLVLARIEAGKKFLEKAPCVVITLGSSIVHELDSEYIVNNRHKQKASLFNPRYLSVAEIIAYMEHIEKVLIDHFNVPQIIWTVSPIRHHRSGLIENNRSKARLILAVQDFIEQKEKHSYFPAYELLIDVLRDHRFYETDLVHPSQQASLWIIEQFVATNFHPSAQEAWEKLKQFHRLRSHRVINDEPEVQKQHDQKVRNARKELKAIYPWFTAGE